MARTFVGTSHQNIQVTDTAILRPNNVSISIWFQIGFDASHALICKPFNGPPWTSPFVSWLIRVNGLATMEFDVGNGTTYSGFTPSFTTVVNRWYHALLTYDGTTVTAYMNGSSIGTNTTVSGNIGYTAGKPLIFGADYGSSPFGDELTGKLAEGTFWNVALTSSEAAALGKGVNSRYIRSGNIIAYYPLWGLSLSEPDMSGNRQTGIVTGATAFNHPPVTLWTRRTAGNPLIQVSGVLNRPPFQYWAA